MKCPYCGKELEIIYTGDPQWIDGDDAAVEIECDAYCYPCDRQFYFTQVYTKIAEKDLKEW